MNRYAQEEKLAMSAKLKQFSEKVVNCQNSNCGYRQTCLGRYPKFSHGSISSKIMVVFQNPGKPTDCELQRDINNVTVDEMRKWAGEGVQRWLFGLPGRGLPRTLFDLGVQDFLGLYYLTQAYRCPDPENRRYADTERQNARKECLQYLKEEIAIVRPIAILAFGKDALRSIRDLLSPEIPIKEISRLKPLFESKTIFVWKNVRVFPMVHPDGFWKNPPISAKRYTETVRWYVEQLSAIESR